jgi:hypothetical protein
MSRLAAVALLLAVTFFAAGCGGFSDAAQGRATAKTTTKATAKSTRAR